MEPSLESGGVIIIISLLAIISINTHDYIITLIQRRQKHYSLYENLMILHLNKHEFPSSKDALCQVWLKLAPVVLEKKTFFIFVKIF